MNEKPNVVRDKAYQFALEIIHLYRSLCTENEFVLSRQLVKAGTSIGANIEEATAAQSKKDFLSKMSIASKEARETLYWLRLLRDSGICNPQEANSLISDTEELIRLLTSIVKTTASSIKN